MPAADLMIEQGTVDRDGRLVAAGSRLAQLQKAAGGQLGGDLVVPQLASLARLARTLGVLVSRGVVVAEGDQDLDLWVRAQSEGEQVRLSIGGWSVRPVPMPDPAKAVERARQFASLEQHGRWRVDSKGRLVSLDAALGQQVRGGDSRIIGQPVTRLFRLIEDESANLPLLDGFLARISFCDQEASLQSAPTVRLMLHGDPKTNAAGEFEGFDCGYRFVSGASGPIAKAAVVSAPAALSQQLETALRSPLARIVAQADEIGMRSDGPLRADYMAYANDISAAGRHLIGLVNDLVDAESVEAAGFSIEAEPIDLADCARRAAGLLAVRAADKSVRIDPPMADEVVPAIGDFRRILQILVNLIGNAVRYSPEGASVWVRNESEGDLASIIVADQGKGIAPEDHERIFEKFERVDASEPGGSGLGLYISRRLARAMGGDITLDSAPGMGARFILTLPTG